MRGLRLVGTCSQDAEGAECWNSAGFLFPPYIQSSALAHRKLSIIFRVGLQFRLSRNSWTPGSTFLSVAMVKLSNQKQRGEGKGLFHLLLLGHSPPLREVRRLKKKLWRNDAPLTDSCLASLLKHDRTTWSGATHGRLSPPIPIDGQDTPLTDMYQVPTEQLNSIPRGLWTVLG